MWDDSTQTLYYQVGIGDGNGCGSICGDHDIWRLPQADDTYGGSDPAVHVHPQRGRCFAPERPANS